MVGGSPVDAGQAWAEEVDVFGHSAGEDQVSYELLVRSNEAPSVLGGYTDPG